MRLSLLILTLLCCGCHAAGTSTSQCSPGGCPPGGEACREQCQCEGHGTLCGHSVRHHKYFRPWDNWITEHSARCAAKSSLHEGKDPCRCNTDYREGYEQAFVDVARGGNGLVPTTPPAYYWSKCARSENGHEKAQNWFAGYAAGAPLALCHYAEYNKVASSGVPGYPPAGAEYGYGSPDGYGPPAGANCPPTYHP